MSSVAFLARVAPPWFEIQVQSPTALQGIARHGPWNPDGLDLTIREAPVPTVGETVPGTCLPEFCPERHIQGNRTFCVGLGRPPVTNVRSAAAWWSDLDQYLACQAVAEAMGIWPPQHALDHGQAGYYHQTALRLAARLGIMDAYLEAHAGAPSWLTSTGLGQLGEGRRPPGERRLRKPRVTGGRKGQRLLIELVVVERRRRKALAAYWRQVEAGTQLCCGCMRDCRFPKAAAADVG